MSLLPRNVAMEMKEDFLKPPERIFHKIYIQRHDNVRQDPIALHCCHTANCFNSRFATFQWLQFGNSLLWSWIKLSKYSFNSSLRRFNKPLKLKFDVLNYKKSTFVSLKLKCFIFNSFFNYLLLFYLHQQFCLQQTLGKHIKLGYISLMQVLISGALKGKSFRDSIRRREKQIPTLNTTKKVLNTRELQQNKYTF